jgi:hypothetical protein
MNTGPDISFRWYEGIKVCLSDGIYQVRTSYLCAGFTVKDGCAVECAPILRKSFSYWTKRARRVGRVK